MQGVSDYRDMCSSFIWAFILDCRIHDMKLYWIIVRCEVIHVQNESCAGQNICMSANNGHVGVRVQFRSVFIVISH